MISISLYILAILNQTCQLTAWNEKFLQATNDKS